MRRRGTSARAAHGRSTPAFEFMVTPALGRGVVAVARNLVEAGCQPAEAASLLAHAAVALAKCPKGLGRSEWLALCAELWDEPGNDSAITTTGGEA
jgi:hypothetical protein